MSALSIIKRCIRKRAGIKHEYVNAAWSWCSSDYYNADKAFLTTACVYWSLLKHLDLLIEKWRGVSLCCFVLSEVNNKRKNIIDKNCIASLFGVLVKKIDLSIIYRSQSRGHAFLFSLHHHHLLTYNVGLRASMEFLHVKSIIAFKTNYFFYAGSIIHVQLCMLLFFTCVNYNKPTRNKYMLIFKSIMKQC